MSKPVFEAVLKSSLLGPLTYSGHLIEESIWYYERYGTQWDTEERFGENGWGARLLDEDLYENMPPVPGLEGGAPIDTVRRQFISHSSEDPIESQKTDTGWIAHFYLFPNYFMWPNTTELALLAPPLLKLNNHRNVPGTRHPTRLHPEPSGSLALVVVSSQEMPPANVDNRFSLAFDAAYDTAVGVLDYLSVQYDTTLPIAHTALIGTPSGTAHFLHAHRPKVKTIERSDRLLPGSPHPELRAAYALYREAASSNNSFHRFMAFWRVYEEADYVRSEWRKQHKKKDTKVQREVLPEALFGFGGELTGKKTTFEAERQELRKPFRVALAHAGQLREGNKSLTAASAEDMSNVSVRIPALRYMARVVLKNVEATLDSTATLADGSAEPKDEAGK